MAESHGAESDDRSARSHSRSHDKKSHRVEIHRVNDLLLGHVGRVSYKPVDDEEAEVGELDSNRMTEEPPSFHFLSSFEEWLSSTRINIDLPSASAFQRSRSQKYWLLKTHPEAFLGNLDLPSHISEETRACGAESSEMRIGSVLAIGEIIDLRNSRSSRDISCPAVAMAAGEAGQTLRIAAIYAEKWTWRNFSVPVGSPQSKFQGSWCSDGTAISKLQFATKLRQFDNIRWLVAQKETSTIIFEPEIRVKPVSGALVADHIAMNRIVTLTTDDTGGSSQSDFSVNLGYDTDVPQLAIIDRFGHWSIWYIERHGNGRSRSTKAVLRSKGIWDMALSVQSWIDAGPLGQNYRVVWVSRSGNLDELARDSTPSEESAPHSRGVHERYLSGIGTFHVRHENLLICNGSQLQTVDVKGGENPPWLDFSRRYRGDIMLEAQACYGSPCHIFVLTTDKVYLIDVSAFREQEERSPNVLISCRHFRNEGRKGLKMLVTKLPSFHNMACLLVSLYSPQNSRIDLFWFKIAQQQGAAQFHHQVVQLPAFETSDTGDAQGIESLAVVPLTLCPNGQGNSQDVESPDMSTQISQVQFYQLFGLTSNLSLQSSIVAITYGAVQKPASPVKVGNTGWDEARWSRFLRKKVLRESEKAFVLPDEDVESQQCSLVPFLKPAERRTTVQLRYYLIKVVEEINRAFSGAVAKEAVKVTLPNPFDQIQETLVSRDEDDHHALKPLITFSDLWQPLELSRVADDWDMDLEVLIKSQSLRLLDSESYGAKLGVADLFEKMSIDWSAPLSAESLKATQWRYIELALERMAAEVYLSSHGIYMMPQSTLNFASKAIPIEYGSQFVADNGLDVPQSSPPRPDVAFLTPTATPTSSRANSEGMTESQKNEKEKSGHEDPAVARLRMYLPSIQFCPPLRDGSSRVISLWPEKRGNDPAEYKYAPAGKALEPESEAASRKREKAESRRRRRAERLGQLGVGESFSQPVASANVRSSPLPQNLGGSQAIASGSSQVHSQGFGFESQSQLQGFGVSQTMSQPLPGQFGKRPSGLRTKKKKTLMKKPMSGFK